MLYWLSWLYTRTTIAVRVRSNGVSIYTHTATTATPTQRRVTCARAAFRCPPPRLAVGKASKRSNLKVRKLSVLVLVLSQCSSLSAWRSYKGKFLLIALLIFCKLILMFRPRYEGKSIKVTYSFIASWIIV